MDSKNVSAGLGCSVDSINHAKKRQSDELIEGKHFIIDRSYKNTPKIYWTKRGIVRLGFFIKAKKPKRFETGQRIMS